MLSARDSQIVNQWLERWTSPHTRGCYRRDSDRLFARIRMPLDRIALGDLQDFGQSLVEAGLAPISRVRMLAAAKNLFSFCCRMGYLSSNPAAELVLPGYEKRLAERIIGEEEVKRLLETDTKPRYRALLRLLYGAGVRTALA